MPKRSEKRDAAQAEYFARKAQGERVDLQGLAEELGVSYQTLRNWKTLDKWDKNAPKPKKKRGGQPGNKNSKGKKNAAGPHPGAPKGNKNAEKDGAYSAVFLDMLTEDERAIIDKMPMKSREALEHEMKILKFRENKILAKIAEYEKAPEDVLYLTSVADMGTFEMTNKDSAFSRVMKLQEALYKVQGRIAKIIDIIKSMDETEGRMALERDRLEIMRMRATGSVPVEDPAQEDDDPEPTVPLEDVTGEEAGET